MNFSNRRFQAVSAAFVLASFPSKSLAQEAGVKTSIASARGLRGQKAALDDSVSVILVSVPKLDDDGVVAQVLRMSSEADRVYLLVTESARARDVARALQVISRAVMSTVKLETGEFRAPILPAPESGVAPEAKIAEASRLLGDLRSSVKRLQVDGREPSPSLSIRLPLEVVATNREPKK